MYKFDIRGFEIYDINSNSWRNLDVTPIPDHYLPYSSYNRVSLKGKTYWLAYDDKEKQLGLITFDYTRERFERLCLPYQCAHYESESISVVGEEKLLVLLQRRKTRRREIWVTNKIDEETKEMSWSKLLEVGVSSVCNTLLSSFFVDEEKKTVVCCEKCIYNGHLVIKVLSVVGEDIKAKQEDLRVKPMRPCKLVLSNYVPSLIQIQQPSPKGKGKRKSIEEDMAILHRKIRL
ncbi:putative F-box protein [Cardamine amara subsp. amara]|uniref:F-box protein n=1 Tax=Cardamine amara subsp. amara TaxID=228776 RepID=A0ABD0ZK24_CARAN